SDNVKIVLCNKPGAKVIERAQSLETDTFIFTREDFYNSKLIIEKLQEYAIDYIILAGFLWLLPSELVSAFPGSIINIHPALLPKYGGKGMYGSKVHEAIIANKEKESGITIHYVNERYDEGSIIFQAKCIIEEDDTPETLAARIHELEYEHFPRVIGEVLKGKVKRKK
ncbi:MAG: phosphoribosylglycinamide formyltransferase, partial [Bacteroidales bacterium]|nr:phosphoribosylglycinamide formyltransferase [Bacteroidales bacterium]